MSVERVLTILQVNDSHGYLEPHWEWFWRGSTGEHRVAGGYGRIASILAAARRERPGAVLAFDCGDTIHGTHAAVESQGQALVPVLNALAFDAMTAHWEFAYGPARFREIVGQLHYPMLATNCYDKASGELAFPPYTICEAGGLRVGVIGIAATIVDKTMPASYSEGLRFTLGNEELPGHIARLRREERADLVVVIAHLGFPQEVRLAEEVSGIDVLLSGHTHNRLYRPAVVNGAIIIQSGCHGSFVGRLDLHVSGGRVVGYTHRLITVNEDIPADPEVEALAREATTAWRGELGGVVGETLTPLNRYTVLEATMDNLLLQALLHTTSAQVAFSNGWRYGAPIPPGPITRNDLWNIIPVNPPVSTCRLTGDELWAMLEENLEHTFSRDPYKQMGGYVKRCLGLNAYVKVENPPGQRIQELFVGNEAVRADRTYQATFVTSQGVPDKYGSDRQHLDVRAVDALQEYLARSSPVDARLRGTVVAALAQRRRETRAAERLTLLLHRPILRPGMTAHHGHPATSPARVPVSRLPRKPGRPSMHALRRFGPGAILLALLAILPAGCRPAQPGSITIGVRSASDHAPFFIADRHGLYAEQDLDVTVQVIPSNTEVVEALQRGDLQMGAIPVTTAIAAIAQGKPIRIVAMTGRGSDGLLVRADGPTSVADLRGRRIATIRASILDVLLRHALQQAGLDPDRDVELVYLAQLGELIAALKTGQVDACSNTEPFMTDAEEQGWGRILTYYTAAWPDHPCCVVVARDDMLRRREQTVRTVLDVHCRAVDWAQDHPSETAAIIADTLGGFGPEVVEASLAPAKMRIDCRVQPDEIARMAELMATQGLIDEVPAIEDLVDLGPLNDVGAEP